MPKVSQTRRASWKSCAVVQYASSSSSQLDMNSPCTACPSRCNRSAATAESTPPDMPTITVPASVEAGEGVRISGRGACMCPLYGCRRPIRVQELSAGLHEHLSHLRFLHARLPDLVEKFQITAHDGRIVQVRNAVPAIRLESVHQCLVVGDDECPGTRRILRPHGTQIDAAGQAACECKESVVIDHGPRRVGEQNAHLGVGARQYQALDRFEKGLFAVNQ